MPKISTFFEVMTLFSRYLLIPTTHGAASDLSTRTLFLLKEISPPAKVISGTTPEIQLPFRTVPLLSPPLAASHVLTQQIRASYAALH